MLMDRMSRELATLGYFRNQSRRRLIVSSISALLAASVAATYAGLFGRCSDDWSRFDHHQFIVSGVDSGDSLQIGSTETVRLLGIVAADAKAKSWLTDRALGRGVTLLLQSPQTRDSSGRLLAFAFVDQSDLSVELTAAGLAFADRREKTVMDGLIDPAEAEARKKKLGIWANLKFDQMPEWRKAWLRTLPVRTGIK